MKNMKIAAAVVVAAMMLAGCGTSKTASTASGASTSEAVSVASQAESASNEIAYDSAPTTSETTSTADDFTTFVTLGNYKGLTIVAPEGTVTANGMTVNIDYKGTIDGTAFDGGTAQGQNLKLGSGSFIDGFEDQLVGHKKGDQVTVTVTFPSDYGVESLNGKEAQFACTINEVYEQTTDEAMQSLVQESKMEQYPQDLIDSWTNYFESQYESAAKQAGQSVKDYMNSIGYTEEMMNYNVKTYAKTEVVARAMMKAEGITTDSQEYRDAQDTALGSYGLSSLSEATSSGIGDQAIQYLTEYQLAANIIEKYAAK